MPAVRQRRGRNAVEIISHGTNGSQIRSTSALLIRLRSAVAMMATPAPVSASATRLCRSAQSSRAEAPARASPAATIGPVQKASAARFPQSQYVAGRLRAIPSQ